MGMESTRAATESPTTMAVQTRQPPQRKGIKERTMQMIKQIITTGVLFLVTAQAAMASTVGILSCGRGVHGNPIPCTGAGCDDTDGAYMLTGSQTCPAGDYLDTGTAKVTYIQGVCGDHDPDLTGFTAASASCGEHFYYRYEYCTPSSTPASQGNLISSRGWGRWRVCYDDSPTPTGDCSGTIPVGIVISSGTMVGFGRNISGGDMRTETSHHRRVTQQNFYFNGLKSMSFRHGVGHYTAETSSPCPAGGCGFEGCLIKHQ